MSQQADLVETCKKRVTEAEAALNAFDARMMPHGVRVLAQKAAFEKADIRYNWAYCALRDAEMKIGDATILARGSAAMAARDPTAENAARASEFAAALETAKAEAADLEIKVDAAFCDRRSALDMLEDARSNARMFPERVPLADALASAQKDLGTAKLTKCREFVKTP